jgi:2-dehydropantoate 2-reductase
MKICVYGAGAIGGHVAVRLAKGGAQVSLVAREATVQAVRTRGLTARTPDGDINVSVTASGDARDLGAQDYVIVTVKAPALPSVATGIAPLLGPQTAVMFAMNGLPWWYFYKHGGPMDGRKLPLVDPDDAVWNAVGPARAIGAVVNTACTVIEPGLIQVSSPVNRFALGEPDETRSERVESLAAAMRAGGFVVDVTMNIRDEIFEKLIGNLCGVPLATLTLAKAKDVYANPTCVNAIRRIYGEVSALAAALGRRVNLDIETLIEKGRNLNHKASMAQDLERGRAMEIDAMFTAPLTLARELKIATPTLDLFAALVRLRAQGAGLYTGTPLRR